MTFSCVFRVELEWRVRCFKREETKHEGDSVLAHRSYRCGFVVHWNWEWGVSEGGSWHGSFLVRALRNGEPIYSDQRENRRLALVQSFSSTKSTIWHHPWTTTLMLGLIGRHAWGVHTTLPFRWQIRLISFLNVLVPGSHARCPSSVSQPSLSEMWALKVSMYPFVCGAFSCKNDIRLSAVVVVKVEIYWWSNSCKLVCIYENVRDDAHIFDEMVREEK